MNCAPSVPAFRLDELAAGRVCPHCQLEIPPQAPLGLCPVCLLEGAIKAADEASEEPRYVGDYELLDYIARGGMGVVYKARRIGSSEIVALKMILHGELASEAEVYRFYAEVEAVRALAHPNVVPVYDSGEDDGIHYFTMKYTAGGSLADQIDAYRDDPRRAAELVATIAMAVHYGHDRGILHRDLKPANILLDEMGNPYVADFGLAKHLDKNSGHTRSGFGMCTPEYMSPEQAGMDATGVDTRTDVYSLGVLLYELLSGTLPFDSKTLRAAGYAEIQRIIREVDPPHPATRLSSMGERASEIAKRRQTQVDELCSELTRELEWIPLKAIRKDRAERYRSAAQLADDIRNYLAGKPLLAGPESTAYRLRKFARRHRVGVSVVALIAAILVGSSAVLAVLLAQTRAAQRAADAAAQEARTEAQKSKAVTDFVSDLLRSADPGRDGRQVKVADLLDRADSAISRTASTQPEIAAAMHELVGATYEGLGLYENASKQFRACLDIRTRVLGEEHPDTYQAKANLAPALQPLGKDDEAQQLLTVGIAGLAKAYGAEHRNTLLARASMAKLKHETGKIEEATTLFREVCDAGLRSLPENDDQLPMWLGTLGVLLTDSGKMDEAKSYADKALDRARRTLGNEHPTTQYCMNVLARWHQQRGEFEPAEKLYKEAYAAGLKVLGEEHQSTLYWMNNVARILQDQKKFEEAAGIYEKLIEVQTRVMGPENADTLMFRSNLARCYQDLKQFDKAEPQMREVVEMGKKTLTMDHVNCMIWQNNLAKLLELKGKPEDAQPLYAEVVEAARKNLPETHNVRLTFELNLGGCELLLSHFDKAEPLMLNAEKQFTTILPAGHATLKAVRTRLADMYDKMKQPDKAAEWRAKAQ